MTRTLQDQPIVLQIAEHGGPPGGVRCARFNGQVQTWSSDNDQGRLYPYLLQVVGIVVVHARDEGREVPEVVNGALFALIVAVAAVMVLAALYVGGFLG